MTKVYRSCFCRWYFCYIPTILQQIFLKLILGWIFLSCNLFVEVPKDSTLANPTHFFPLIMTKCIFFFWLIFIVINRGTWWSWLAGPRPSQHTHTGNRSWLAGPRPSQHTHTGNRSWWADPCFQIFNSFVWRIIQDVLFVFLINNLFIFFFQGLLQYTLSSVYKCIISVQNVHFKSYKHWVKIDSLELLGTQLIDPRTSDYRFKIRDQGAIQVSWFINPKKSYVCSRTVFLNFLETFWKNGRGLGLGQLNKDKNNLISVSDKHLYNTSY